MWDINYPSYNVISVSYENMGSYLIIVLEDQPQRVIFGEIFPGPVDEDHQLVADTKKSATNHSRRFP